MRGSVTPANSLSSLNGDDDVLLSPKSRARKSNII